jgi:hypothetical protein
MITKEDKLWLHSNYPTLIITDETISGTIVFEATYNPEINKFLLLSGENTDTIGGIRLRIKFQVTLQDRIDKSNSSLPALAVLGIDPIPDRHFIQKDKTACLCSPFEEGEFLLPTFNFIFFFEELVIPFLYSQEYFSQYQKWPWQDYSHGALGLLESYYRCADPTNALDCLQRVSREFSVFPKIRKALSSENAPKGHHPCICPKEVKVRKCHRIAWLGLNMLRIDIRTQGHTIPEILMFQSVLKM